MAAAAATLSAQVKLVQARPIEEVEAEPVEDTEDIVPVTVPEAAMTGGPSLRTLDVVVRNWSGEVLCQGDVVAVCSDGEFAGARRLTDDYGDAVFGIVLDDAGTADPVEVRMRGVVPTRAWGKLEGGELVGLTTEDGGLAIGIASGATGEVWFDGLFGMEGRPTKYKRLRG